MKKKYNKFKSAPCLVPKNLPEDITDCDLDANKIRCLIDLVGHPKRKKYISDRGFTCLSDSYLIEQLKTVPQPYIRHLKARGIIECDNHFVRGKKAFGYRLLPPYDDQYSVLHGKYRKLLPKAVPENYQKLNRYLTQLTIDFDEAVSFLYRHGLHQRHLKPLYKIAAGRFRSSIDGSGRFHSSITSLKKELRGFLRFEGQPLVGFDISACQVHCLNLMLKGVVDNDRIMELLVRYGKSIDTNPNTIHQLSYEKELEKWLEMCESNKIYGFFAEKIFQKKGVSEREIKIAKRLMLEMLNKKPNWKSEVRHIFRNEFPQIHEFICWIQSKDHKCMNHLLTSLETELVINRVVATFPYPIWTIHDCVYTTYEHEFALQLRLQTEAREYFNADVKFKLDSHVFDSIREVQRHRDRPTSFVVHAVDVQRRLAQRVADQRREAFS